MWCLVEPGDSVLVPEPSYPIHAEAPRLAGASVFGVRVGADQLLISNLHDAYERASPKPWR